MIDVENLTIKTARELLDKKEISSLELTRAYLAEIEKENQNLNAFLEVFSSAESEAMEADKRINDGTQSTLTGIPAAYKDNILIKGKTASAASKMLENYTATYDSTVTKILKNEGVVHLGRTNMDEFAMGSSTENSAFGITKNPHSLKHVPGGSSGGSAAAVAAGLSMFALGSDTAGSVRQPASFCGVVGLKPTYGSVSRHGLIAMGSSLDCIGPLTKTVSDSEIIFNHISGPDQYDATTASLETRQKEKRNSKPKKIGIPRNFIEKEGVNDYVIKNFENSLKTLEDLGYEIVDIELSHANVALAAYYIILPAEVSTNLSRLDGVRYGHHKTSDDLFSTYLNSRSAFGPEARRRIILGTYVLSAGYYDAYYKKAINVREIIKQELRDTFDTVDIIATPTAPTKAFKIGEKADPLSMYMGDIFTIPSSITGTPAISIPSGKSDDGLPLGIQFIAPHFNEHYLFSLGKDFEDSHQSL